MLVAHQHAKWETPSRGETAAGKRGVNSVGFAQPQSVLAWLELGRDECSS